MGFRKKNFTELVGNTFNKYTIFFILALILAVLAIAAPNFITSKNLLNILRQISFVSIVAFGEAAVIISGGIDLSVGSIVAVGSMMTAIFASQNQCPLILIILIGPATGAIIGLINGFMVSKLKLPPFIATLGTLTSGAGIATWITRGDAINNLKAEFNYIGYGKVLEIPISVLVLIAVVIITHLMLKKTRFGMHIFAIGGNEQAAKFSGINITLEKIKVYTFSGLLAGLAAMLLTARVASGQPAAGIGYELDAIAAAVIGGTSLQGGVGTAIGVLAGALIIGVISNGMTLLNVDIYMQQFVRGIIIIAAVSLDSLRKRT